MVHGNPTDIAKMPADDSLYKSLMVFSNNSLLLNEEQVSNITQSLLEITFLCFLTF